VEDLARFKELSWPLLLQLASRRASSDEEAPQALTRSFERLAGRDDLKSQGLRDATPYAVSVLS